MRTRGTCVFVMLAICVGSPSTAFASDYGGLTAGLYAFLAGALAVSAALALTHRYVAIGLIILWSIPVLNLIPSSFVAFPEVRVAVSSFWLGLVAFASATATRFYKDYQRFRGDSEIEKR